MKIKGKVIVIGAGAWGGWSAFLLKKAGYHVTLVDKSDPGNVFSGSGGKTRIIRIAYGGNTIYTEMAHRSFQLWEEHAAAWKEILYHEKPALWMFKGVPPLYAELSKPLMAERGYALDEISMEEIKSRYPQINLKGITSAYIEPKVAYLEASRSCQVVTDEFLKLGGEFLQTEVIGIEGNQTITGLITKEGNSLKANHYVFACGPWMTKLFPQLTHLIRISRHEVFYFEAPEDHLGAHLPIWLEFREGDQMYYGIPDHFSQGFKFAYDERKWPLNPDRDERNITPEILEKMSSIVANRFPALKGAGLVKHHTCVYENSLDGDFIMDTAPRFSNATILCGSSGHGFKMGPAVGEIVAQWLDEKRCLPSEFTLSRFGHGQKVKSQFEVL